MKKNTITGGLNLRDIYFKKAQGATVWDEEDNQYIDFISGYGTVSLGHANYDVNKSVLNAIKTGQYFYGKHKSINQLEEEILEIWNDKDTVNFFKTGSEAVQAAVRIARAVTSKNKIIRCGFHGWHDLFMTSDTSWHRMEVSIDQHTRVQGVPEKLNELILSIPFDPELLLKTLNENSDIAALLIDPVQIKQENISEIKLIIETCKNNSTLFILDEVKTALRTPRFSAQSDLDIHPDISILGKGLANGFPLSAIAYNRTLTQSLTNIKLMGTFNNEISSIAAAITTVRKYKTDQLNTKINELGSLFIKKTNELLNEHNLLERVEMVPFRWNSMPYLQWKNKLINTEPKFFSSFLLTKGIIWLPNHMNFINPMHTELHFDHFSNLLVEYCKSNLE